MKIVAIMPIKLQNERLPGKNTKLLGDKPLLQYELVSLIKTDMLDSVNVYCSNESVCEYLPDGVNFIKRPEFLDLPTSNFSQIFLLTYTLMFLSSLLLSVALAYVSCHFLLLYLIQIIIKSLFSWYHILLIF